ncbi:hypothetical protein ACN38_g8931 [Penicillium nordicum]|uniref:Uncharacterized protein n=1 Tax=Penicillium nordicum TaxID=229535 RepID=A0A0M8NVG7_9EURO|nr:hypothetical protein ACN38_g8931 [Penicillium nordicum]
MPMPSFLVSCLASRPGQNLFVRTTRHYELHTVRSIARLTGFLYASYYSRCWFDQRKLKYRYMYKDHSLSRRYALQGQKLAHLGWIRAPDYRPKPKTTAIVQLSRTK